MFLFGEYMVKRAPVMKYGTFGNEGYFSENTFIYFQAKFHQENGTRERKSRGDRECASGANEKAR